jgi:hypothetical protein
LQIQGEKMFKRYVPVLAILAILLTACGAQATPTMNPADVQGTAVAAAWTMVAATQQSIPTEPPPTDTPVPSPTPLPLLPTLTPLSLPTTLAFPTAGLPTGTPNANGDYCNNPIPQNAAGKPTHIKIQNMTKAPVTVSLYLSKESNVNLECGFYVAQLSKNGSATVDYLPQGCYFGSAIINDPKKPTKSFSTDYACIHSDDLVIFQVGTEIIKVVWP